MKCYIFSRPGDNKYSKANPEDNTVNKALVLAKVCATNNKPTKTSCIYLPNYF